MACIFAIHVLAGAAAAQFIYGGFSDVRPYVSGSALATDAHDDPTGTNVPSVRVFQYRFQNDPNDPYFTQDPGFNAQAGDLTGGSFLSFDALSSLTYWNGVGSVTMSKPPSSEQLQLDYGANDRYVTGNSGSMSGFTIGNVASNGSLHKHLNAFLLGSDGNAVAGDGAVAAAGVYFTSLRLNTGAGIASSAPIFLVYGNGVSNATFLQAVLANRDTNAPGTNLANASSNWQATGSGSWDAAGNWDGGVPDAVSLQASFGSTITAPAVVTTGSARTVGTINFASTNSYTIAGSGTINLKMFAGATAGINVSSGTQVISAPLQTANNVAIAVASSSLLTLSNDFGFASGTGLTKNGDGTLAMKNVRANSLQINVGSATSSVLQILSNGTSAATSVVKTLGIASGAALDLTNNALVVDYTGPTPLASLNALVASGYAGGHWNGTGINSSTVAAVGLSRSLGIAEASAINASTFAGQAVDSTAVLISYAYTGDVNLDGRVDISDLTILASHFQQSGNWATGDLNYDGKIDLSDLTLLASNFQAGVAHPTLSFNQALTQVAAEYGNNVPEPSALRCILTASAAGLLARRRIALRTSQA